MSVHIPSARSAHCHCSSPAASSHAPSAVLAPLALTSPLRDTAPVALFNEKLHENLTIASVDKLIDEAQKGTGGHH